MPGWCMGAWRGQGRAGGSWAWVQEGGLGRCVLNSQRQRLAGRLWACPPRPRILLLFSQAMQHFEGKKCGGHFGCCRHVWKGPGEIYPPIRARTR